MKRVRRVEREPNPLFRRWLEEFRAEAAARDNKGLVRLYDQCLHSLGERQRYTEITYDPLLSSVAKGIF
jgi:hypothetical protein